MTGHAAVEVVMSIPYDDGQAWTIPVIGSLVETKRLLNGGDTLVSLDIEGGDPMAVNPAHVAAIRVRREVPTW